MRFDLLNQMKKQLAILGSTGSIGTQTLEVVAEYPDLFEVYTLTANNNVDLLIEQAKHFNPDSVVIANEAHYNKLKEALKDFPIKIYAGENAISEIVEAAAHRYSSHGNGRIFGVKTYYTSYRSS